MSKPRNASNVMKLRPEQGGRFADPVSPPADVVAQIRAMDPVTERAMHAQENEFGELKRWKRPVKRDADGHLPKWTEPVIVASEGFRRPLLPTEGVVVPPPAPSSTEQLARAIAVAQTGVPSPFLEHRAEHRRSLRERLDEIRMRDAEQPKDKRPLGERFKHAITEK